MEYVKLYHDLLELLPSGSIQELMEIAYRHIRKPILATDVTYQLLGIYPQQKTGKPYWDRLFEQGKYDTKTIMELYEDGIMQSADQQVHPYLVDWGRAAKQEPKIVGLIRVNGHTEGYISILCEKEECTEELLGAVEIIQKICSLLYQEKRSQSNMATMQTKAFANELLRGKLTSREELLLWQRNMEFYPAGSFQILVIQGSTQNTDAVFSNFYVKFLEISHQQLSLIRYPYLYILIYDLPREGCMKIADQLEELLTDFHLKCGCSDPFDDLLQTQIFIEQASVGLKTGKKHAPKEPIYKYPNYALLSLIESGSDHVSSWNGLHPMITMLQEYDALHHSELYATLASYIYAMGQPAQIVKELHIHRNSLPYRLRKIESITGYSLQNFETILHLSINFYLKKQKEV